MSNPVYGKKAAPSRNGEKLTGPAWALVVAFILFLIWTPFQVGLFNGQMLDFERPIYITALLSGLMLLLWLAVYYKQFKLAEERDALALGGLLLPLTYALSLLVAVSRYNAMNMLFIQATYGAVFIIILYLVRQNRANQILQNAVLAIVYFIVGFGLLNWLGASKFAGGLVGWFSNTVKNGIYLDAVMTDSNGLRLTSIFQYANTYAAFLMAFLFVALFALIRSRKWYGTVAHGLMMVPIIISLLLTLSRGAMVLLPVVFIVLLLMLKPVQQILWIMHLAAAGLLSLVIIGPVTTLGTELNAAFDAGSAAKGWAYLLGASLVSAGLSWIIQRYIEPWLRGRLGGWEQRKLAGLWLPAGSVALIAAAAFILVGTQAKSLLPANIETRLENINFRQHSVLERFTFYKDALKVSKDYPVLGAGGGGWASLYEHYQNNPYTSRQVHNFFLQFLIEVGILGFVIFMGFILYIFYKYIRGYLKREKNDFENGFFYFIIAFSILVHSLLDFNMSYAFMGILVFLGLGGMASAMHSRALPAAWNRSGVRYGYLGLLSVCTVVLLVLSIRTIGSSNAAMDGKALTQVSHSYEEIRTPLVKALKTRPYHGDSALLLAALNLQVYQQTQDTQYSDEAESVLKRALGNEPYNKNLLRQLASLYDLRGESDPAFNVFRDNADKFNWDMDWYEAVITRASDLGVAAHYAKDAAKEQEYSAAVEEAYSHVTEGVEHLKSLPPEQLQGRPFSVTPAMALGTGTIRHLAGDSEGAADALKAGLTGAYEGLAADNGLWSADWYNELVRVSQEQAQAAYTQQDALGLGTHVKLGLAAYSYAAKEAAAAGNTIPASMALNAGKVQYFSGDVRSAVNTFKGSLSDDYSDPLNRELARWYAAGTVKLTGTPDPDVYNKLIAADANEAAQVEQLAAMRPLGQ